MKKQVMFFCLLTCPVWSVRGQLTAGQIDPSEIPALDNHYQPEYTFDKPTDPVQWTRQKSGLHVAFGSADASYLRCEVPQVAEESQKWEETAWRGERVNAQILTWSPDTLDQVRFKMGDLVSAQGQVLDKKNYTISLVRYVLSNYPYAAKNTGCDGLVNDTVFLLPDRLEAFERFVLPGRTVRPVWLSLDIPENAEPGTYRGTVEISSEKHHAVLNVSIRVQDLVLPAPRNRTFRLDLWQNPWVVASYYQVEPWSEEHKMLLKKHLKLYADAGGKYVTTYAVYSPWADNSYTIEGTMIDWTMKKDGSWKFDYSVFDQYVQIAKEAGIEGAITIYTPVPWGYRFRYMDEQTGNNVYEEWPPDSKAFKANWNMFLDDLKAHLKEKGWFGKTYLGINENPLDVTIQAVKVIRENSPDWKITYAGDWHPELSSLLDDYCTVIKSEPDPESMSNRKAHGKTTTFYVCCTPPQPNNFVFSPPAEGRYIGWYAAAYGYDGFLRWAYDAWPADPMRDARHIYWPAGDCFLVYPGGNSSVRFEKLREGISDYEKIKILRELVSKSVDKEVLSLMNELNMHLASFTGARDYNQRNYNVDEMMKYVEKGKRLVIAISDALKNSK